MRHCIEADDKRDGRFRTAIIDITGPKQATESLRESEERLHLAVTGTTDGIWDLNGSPGRIIGRRLARRQISIHLKPICTSAIRQRSRFSRLSKEALQIGLARSYRGKNVPAHLPFRFEQGIKL